MMDGKTHLIIGMATGMAVTQILNVPVPIHVGATIGALGGLLPDIDHPQSYITSFVPFGFLVSKLFGGHRGITHTLTAWGVIYLALSELVFIPYLMIFGIAYLSHLIADMCTADGVPLLYPALDFRFKILPGGILRWTSFIFEAAALLASLALIVYIIWKAS